jgi:hypothetical protein
LAPAFSDIPIQQFTNPQTHSHLTASVLTAWRNGETLCAPIIRRSARLIDRRHVTSAEVMMEPPAQAAAITVVAIVRIAT